MDLDIDVDVDKYDEGVEWIFRCKVECIVDIIYYESI